MCIEEYKVKCGILHKEKYASIHTHMRKFSANSYLKSVNPFIWNVQCLAKNNLCYNVWIIEQENEYVAHYYYDFGNSKVNFPQ